MMKNNPLIILSAVLALLASCTPRQADDEIPATAAGTAPLQIESVGLQGSDGNSSSNDGNSTTRAADATTPVPLEEGIIGVFRIATNANSFPAQNNVSYTGKGGTWAPTVATDMIKLNSQPDKVCAYYPRQSSFTDPTAITLSHGSLDERLGVRYPWYNICYATGRDVSSQYPSTSFEMKHAMALLRFHFKRDKDETTYIRLDDMTMQASDQVLITRASFDITKEGATPVVKSSVSKLAGCVFDAPVVVPADGSSEVDCAYLVIPTTLDGTSGGITFTFKLMNKDGIPLSEKEGEGTVSANVPYTAFGGKWQAGKMYDISFTVKLGELTLDGTRVKINDWTNVNVGSGDYPATPVVP